MPHLYLIIATVFLLVSCQEETTTESSSVFPEGSVGFSVNTFGTRGTPIMQLPELTSIKVVAYQHTGLWNDVNSSSPATIFMNQTTLLHETDGSWSYSPLKYWPLNRNLSFFGYAPEAATNGVSNQSGLSMTVPTDGTLPEITYSVPTTVENQPDLLICTTPNYNLNRQTNGANSVNMELAHALTCVGFHATGEGERIVGIKVSGIIGSGTIQLGVSPLSWNINSVDTTYTFEAGINGEPLDAVSSSILNENGYLMMIPQILTDAAKVTITVDGGDTPYEQTFSLNIPGKNEWQAGQYAEYNFAVSATGSIILSPGSIILPSPEKSYSSFNIICPEATPDLKWTVQVSNNGWLEICDSPTGVNLVTQINSYTYTGQGSQTLYAYAPAANTSSAELLSEITLAQSSQQIKVTQLYQDEIYIPEYPHGGWAGSNIYWIADNTYPAGGYLTFDDKDVTTHEQYQGVYFMWGSLVALSPMGNIWTGGSQIIYIPNSDPATNGGWDPSLNSGWRFIPRMGWTNNSNPAGGGSAITISYNTNQSYLIKNHAPSKNIGDICKYLTDMGWAPGAKEGRKWRMPTHLEFNKMTDYSKENAPFSYQQSNNAYGQMPYSKGFRRVTGDGTPFFPVSGYRINNNFIPNGGIDNLQNFRPGEAFSYWSSSPNILNGDAFDYIGINNAPTNTQGFERDSGSTIRCVMDNNN